MKRTALAAPLVLALLLVACSSHDLRGASSASPASGPTLSGSVPDDRSVPPAQAAKAPADPANPTGATVDVPDAVAHDCSRDVTADLNSFLAGVSDNSTARFAPNGCYRIDATVEVSAKHTILVDGQGARLQAGSIGDQGRRHLTITASSDVTIRNLTIVGSNDKAGASVAAYDENLAFQHAFNLTGVQRVLLDGVSATKLHGDFVYVGAAKSTESTDVTVRDSKFDGSGRQGISVVAAERVLIADNSLTGVARSMFDIEPNNATSTVRDVRITGNHTGPAVNFWLANKGAGSDIGDIEIDNNTMEAATGGLFFAFGPASGLRGPWLIHDNQFIANDAVTDENAVGAFLFSNCAQITIEHNHVTFPADGKMPAVELRTSKTVHITGNDFVGARQVVLADAATTDVTVS